MIKAIFFDFYNTLVRFWPPVEQIQIASCRKLGVSVTKDGIQKGYSLADDYFTRENSKFPLVKRSVKERDMFFAQYEQLILRGSGLDVTLNLARCVWKLTTIVPKSFVPFDDAIPTLRRLKELGLTLGVLSNLHRDMAVLTQQLHFEPYLDFCITSREVGAEKPHPTIFLSALARAGVNLEEAVHIGDQIYSDVQGAKGIGILPILLDREDRHVDVTDCHRIRSLSEVEGLVGSCLQNAVPFFNAPVAD